MGDEPGMSWKRFQRAIWTLLAVCAGGVFLMCMVSGRGYALVFGQVDDGTIAWTLISIFLLALVVWGDGAIVAFTRGWERVVFLVFVLAAEGLLLLTVLFFSFYFYTNPTYYPIYDPDGEVGLVVRHESWLFDCWGQFYLPAGPCLLRRTGVTYAAHDLWPFHDGYYEIQWTEESIVVHYNTGMGEWETCTVPLD